MNRQGKKICKLIVAEELVKLAKGMIAKPTIDAKVFNKAKDTVFVAENIVENEMPNGDFVFIGIDNQFVYFNVVCKLRDTDDMQIRNLKEKTRFYTIEEKLEPFYLGKFKIGIR